jgi:hypothetical protein
MYSGDVKFREYIPPTSSSATIHANAITIGLSILRVSLDTNVLRLVAEAWLIETTPDGCAP